MERRKSSVFAPGSSGGSSVGDGDSDDDYNSDDEEDEEDCHDMEHYQQYYEVVEDEGVEDAGGPVQEPAEGHNEDEDDQDNEGGEEEQPEPDNTKGASSRRKDAHKQKESAGFSVPPSYYVPPTASTPVTSHFDALLECLDLLRTMEHDASVEKQDVVDSLRSMLNNMLSTVMMHSFATSMSVRGWRVE